MVYDAPTNYDSLFSYCYLSLHLFTLYALLQFHLFELQLTTGVEMEPMNLRRSGAIKTDYTSVPKLNEKY